jgi:hypothetical protein
MTDAERNGFPNGFVGYDEERHFIHYCHCGEWGSFGVGVSTREGKLGRWYCMEHRPQTGEQHGKQA